MSSHITPPMVITNQLTDLHWLSLSLSPFRRSDTLRSAGQSQAASACSCRPSRAGDSRVSKAEKWFGSR
jgi:hypothetical protein